ncbi:hypothetical protein FOPG_19139, partial [Fusarium oxysporum f. sp. conglutinans race 2 54008]
ADTRPGSRRVAGTAGVQDTKEPDQGDSTVGLD